MEGIFDEALAGGADSDFCPDPITVTASVEVVYELERGMRPRMRRGAVTKG